MKEPFLRFIEENLKPCILLITCGLPGTWKTETSQEISRIKGYPILRTDLIRLKILKDQNIFDEKVASNLSNRERVYNEMFRQAEQLAPQSDGVILDATFFTQKLRRKAAEVAAKHDKTLVILQTRSSQETSITRILRRTKENYESNALTREAYLNNKKMFEPVDLTDLRKNYSKLDIIHLIVDTEKDLPEDWYIIGMKTK
jgi:predicted kinase